MAYDAVRGQVVLFGGSGYIGDNNWTWDGTDWTQRFPAHAPSQRDSMGMAYDAAHGEVVLFGGYHFGWLGDTWTWDGIDWRKRLPAHAPSNRLLMGMAYDAAHGQVVLFGGYGGGYLGDTWTWNGADWTMPAVIELTPPTGSPGTVVQVVGSGFGPSEPVVRAFIDATGTTMLAHVVSDGTGAFTKRVTIPLTATAGSHTITTRDMTSDHRARALFRVT